MTIKESLSGIIFATTILASGAGSVYAAERSGLTDVFVQYQEVKCQTYKRARERFPLIFWSDCRDYSKYRFYKYRAAADFNFAIFGMFLSTIILEQGYESLKRRFGKNKK